METNADTTQTSAAGAEPRAAVRTGMPREGGVPVPRVHRASLV